MVPASARGRPSSSRVSCCRALLHHRSDERPHHVAQEGVGRDLELEVSPRRNQAARSTTRTKTSCGVSVGREGPEVVLAHERVGRCRESVLVQGARIPPRAACLERRRPAAAVDPVAVAARPRGEAGVEVVRRLRGRDHRDVVGQLRVERAGSPLGRRPALDVERRDLAERVHARVRAPRDGEAVPAREDLRQRRAQLPLDRAQARLHGPAAEVDAVVLEVEAELHRARRIAATRCSRGSRPSPGSAEDDRGRGRDVPRAGAAVDAQTRPGPGLDRPGRPGIGASRSGSRSRATRHALRDEVASGTALRDEIARFAGASKRLDARVRGSSRSSRSSSED